VKGCDKPGRDIPCTFNAWIRRFKGVDLPIGFLANDVERDPDFPEEDHFGEILEHIARKRGGDADIVETFVLAWNYYLASKRPRGLSAL
jgi:hypothetical protein